MRSFPFRQRGVGFAGWLILILVFGGILTIATKLFPHYMDNNTIENLLDKLATEDGIAAKNKAEIAKIVANRMKLNNIRDFDLEDRMVINRTKNGTQLVMDYEIRVSVMGNLDAIASFKKEIELRD
mgnify:CR=1 FL=1|tara:strand:- start:67972 stop:68349 length:378 start_codon:yes stop_codon:yes gene_type:complete